MPTNTIKGIPYFQAEFDRNGTLTTSVSLFTGITDLFVMSHGWRNDANEATKLYTDFGLLTANPAVTSEVNEVFIHLTGPAKTKNSQEVAS